MKSSTNYSQIATSLVIGVALGAVLGLLLAPNKGSDLRHKLSGKKNKITKNLKDKFDTIMADSKKEAETRLNEVADHVVDGIRTK